MIAYESDRVTLVHAPAETVLPTLEKESFNLILTDPPYGVEFASGFRKDSFGQIDNDGQGDRGLVHDVLRECVRVVGQGRHLYVFGPSDVLDGLKISKVANLIWDKGILGSGDLSAPWGPSHEPISFAVSKFRHAGEIGADALPVRLRKGSVLRFTRPTGRKVRHPNEKPLGLLRELIESSSRQGETVLDPFAGSGSTGIAAVLSGRRAVLIESDERWIPIAIERLIAAERAADAVEAVA